MQIHGISMAVREEIILCHYGIGEILMKYDPSLAALAARETYLAVYNAAMYDPEWQYICHDFNLATESALADYGVERVIPQPQACECTENYTCGHCGDYIARLNYFTTICFDVAAGINLDQRVFELFTKPGVRYVQILDNDHVVIGVAPHG